MKLQRIVSVILVAAILPLAGCIDADTLVAVNKNGSGTIEQTIFFGDSIVQMIKMQMMMSGVNPDDSSFGTSAMLNYQIEQLKGNASSFGNGVKYVSAEEIKRPGKTGVKVVYSFTDVSKLRMDQVPDLSGGGMAGMQEQVTSAPFTFTMVKGEKPRLVITLPQPDAPPADANTRPPPPPPGQMEMIKEMFADSAITFRVKVNGTIKETNATHVDGSTITLLQMQIGKMLADDKCIEKLVALGNEPDLEKVKQALKGMPGLKMETAKSVSVTFE